MHRGASWWRSNVFPCHATPCRLTRRLIEKPSLPCRFSTSLFSEENVSTKRSLTIFVTGNFFAGNLVSLIRSKDTYIPNLCSANFKETRLEESVYIATRNSKHDREEARGRLQFSNIDRKIFQMFPNNCTLRLSRAFYLLHVSACITKLKDCGAIKGGNSGCGNSGCEIGAATSASRQREGSRFERCPATQVSPAALYSVPRVQLCLWLWCCSPRDDRSTSTNRWNLPSCAHTHATDGCIIRKGMVRSWMMARIEGWPPGGSRVAERGSTASGCSVDALRLLAGHVFHWFGISWNAIIVADWADLELLIRHDDLVRHTIRSPDSYDSRSSRSLLFRKLCLSPFFSAFKGKEDGNLEIKSKLHFEIVSSIFSIPSFSISSIYKENWISIEQTISTRR